MKILILTTRGDSIGGAQIHIKDMAVALQEDGHEVIVGVGSEGAFTSLLVKNNIRYIMIASLVRAISPMNDLKAVKNILDTLKSIQPDLLTLHSSKAGILGRVAAKITKTPVIFTAHGWAFTEGVSPKKQWLYRQIERLGVLLADRVITVSKYDKNLAIKYHVGKDNTLYAIHNGMQDIASALMATFENDISVITMVARFQSPKNHKMLLEALATLKTLAWRVQFIGEDGGLMQEVKDFGIELGIDERISYLGHREDIEILLKKSDIFVLTSRWEGFPLTILEAMRAGLPVIASDVGGVSEAVLDKETGFLVRDSDDLKEALQKTLSSQTLRGSLGEAGRKRYEQYFTFETMYQKTLALYREVIQKG